MKTTKPKPRMPYAMREQLRRAINAAEMENASFGSYKVIEHGREHDVTDFAKEVTRLYRQSWILPQLRNVLAWAENEEARE